MAELNELRATYSVAISELRKPPTAIVSATRPRKVTNCTPRRIKPGNASRSASALSDVDLFMCAMRCRLALPC